MLTLHSFFQNPFSTQMKLLPQNQQQFATQHKFSNKTALSTPSLPTQIKTQQSQIHIPPVLLLFQPKQLRFGNANRASSLHCAQPECYLFIRQAAFRQCKSSKLFALRSTCTTFALSCLIAQKAKWEKSTT